MLHYTLSGQWSLDSNYENINFSGDEGLTKMHRLINPTSSVLAVLDPYRDGPCSSGVNSEG